MAKIRQKIGKIKKKNRFSLQQLPKKGHFLKEMLKKNQIAFGKKKVNFFFRACGAIPLTPRGRVLYNFWIPGFCPYTWAKMPFFGKKKANFFFGKKMPKMAQKWSEMAKIAQKSAK